jgi:hypothetical protein
MSSYLLKCNPGKQKGFLKYLDKNKAIDWMIGYNIYPNISPLRIKGASFDGPCQLAAFKVVILNHTSEIVTSLILFYGIARRGINDCTFRKDNESTTGFNQ